MRRMWMAVLLLGSLLGGCASNGPDSGVSLLYEINANVNRTVTYVACPPSGTFRQTGMIA